MIDANKILGEQHTIGIDVAGVVGRDGVFSQSKENATIQSLFNPVRPGHSHRLPDPARLSEFRSTVVARESYVKPSWCSRVVTSFLTSLLGSGLSMAKCSDPFVCWY